MKAIVRSVRRSWPYQAVMDVGRRARAYHHRGDEVTCPICEGRFARFLPIRGRQALCPRCGSVERQRLIWLILKHHTELFLRTPHRLLHFAPEWCLTSRLRRLPMVKYLSGDLDAGRAMRVMDMTNIQLPDASMDAIITSDCLEHIPDDAQALRELYRVLCPGGWAIIRVPVDMHRAVTYEDPSITTNAGRLAAFGQIDHVRVYGRDLLDRMRSAGFIVTAYDGSEWGDPRRHGMDGTPIFLARKSLAHQSVPETR